MENGNWKLGGDEECDGRYIVRAWGAAVLRPYKCFAQRRRSVRRESGCGSWGWLGPGFEEVGGVDGAEAGSEVVARGGGVGGVVIVGRGGEFADDFFLGAVAIVEVAGFGIFAAGNVDVAERDVVEDAGSGGKIAGGLAGVATGGAGGVRELLLRERVVDVVGVALLAVALIDERLNACHRG